MSYVGQFGISKGFKDNFLQNKNASDEEVRRLLNKKSRYENQHGKRLSEIMAEGRYIEEIDPATGKVRKITKEKSISEGTVATLAKMSQEAKALELYKHDRDKELKKDLDMLNALDGTLKDVEKNLDSLDAEDFSKYKGLAQIANDKATKHIEEMAPKPPEVPESVLKYNIHQKEIAEEALKEYNEEEEEAREIIHKLSGKMLREVVDKEEEVEKLSEADEKRLKDKMERDLRAYQRNYVKYLDELKKFKDDPDNDFTKLSMKIREEEIAKFQFAKIMDEALKIYGIKDYDKLSEDDKEAVMSYDFSNATFVKRKTKEVVKVKTPADFLVLLKKDITDIASQILSYEIDHNRDTSNEVSRYKTEENKRTSLVERDNRLFNSIFIAPHILGNKIPKRKPHPIIRNR